MEGKNEVELKKEKGRSEVFKFLAFALYLKFEGIMKEFFKNQKQV
jgi:hypothetical protein